MARKRRGRAVNGWLILDKPAGITSTQALSKVRRLLDAAKAGHAGTLDPLATGILPMAFGEATKVVNQIVDSAKGYRFTLRWGEERDTDDADGTATTRSDERPKEAQIVDVLGRFCGNIEQVPPVYSAIKIDGKRAYDLARDGRPAKLQPRSVYVEKIDLVSIDDDDHATFDVACGKGVYVRSLARDLGRVLGCGAHVASLRRTRVGPFRDADAISLDKLQALGHKAAECALLPVETALADIPALVITGTEAARLKCGQVVRVPSTMQGTVCATADGRLVALADVSEGEVRPVRVFYL